MMSNHGKPNQEFVQFMQSILYHPNRPKKMGKQKKSMPGQQTLFGNPDDLTPKKRK